MKNNCNPKYCYQFSIIKSMIYSHYLVEQYYQSMGTTCCHPSLPQGNLQYRALDAGYIYNDTKKTVYYFIDTIPIQEEFTLFECKGKKGSIKQIAAKSSSNLGLIGLVAERYDLTVWVISDNGQTDCFHCKMVIRDQRDMRLIVKCVDGVFSLQQLQEDQHLYFRNRSRIDSKLLQKRIKQYF